MVVLVEVYYVVLQHVRRNLPLLELTCQNKRLQLWYKLHLHFLFLEHDKQVIEEEVAILELNTELNGNPDEGLVLAEFFFLLRVD